MSQDTSNNPENSPETTHLNQGLNENGSGTDLSKDSVCFSNEAPLFPPDHFLRRIVSLLGSLFRGLLKTDTVFRESKGKWVGGVCSGLGNYSLFPCWAWRLLFIGLTLIYGLGFPVYWLAWMLIPRESREDNDKGFFKEIDWQTFWVTTFLVFLGYWWSLAPNVTLEDSGELSVGSFYAGVPHPPGYPVWTLYTWLFTKLIPFSNIAWRVALSSAVAGAGACGLLALMVSRGSGLMISGVAERFKKDEKNSSWAQIPLSQVKALRLVSGYLAGMLLGFNGFIWSQAVIVEVYTLSVLSFIGVLCLLFRWMYETEKRKYLYWASFLFGISFTNHQTLIVASMGLQVAILGAHRRLGRDLFLINSLVYLLVLVFKMFGFIETFDDNLPLFLIFNAIGLFSLVLSGYYVLRLGTIFSEWKTVMSMTGLWAAGAVFYLYMPLASMSNPPMNWGYPRTVTGFVHAFSRGQYEKTNPTSNLELFIQQVGMYMDGAIQEFNLVYLLIGLVPFFFYSRMRKNEQAWLIGLTSIFACLAFLLLILLNPAPDERKSRELTKVFFAASHVIIAAGIGYGSALIGALVAAQYQLFRIWLIRGSAVAAGIALYAWANLESQLPLDVYTAVFCLFLAVAAVAVFLTRKTKAPIILLLLGFGLMPLYSIMSHWADNEQRNHMFGYWFGHDMFEPPFGIYDSMAKDAILFGGTDPGRFNPTYMIFCESFLDSQKKVDPDFDRRDVYIITQNALADGTYLEYIRAHYHRSSQIDPPFFSELVRSSKSRENGSTNLLSRSLVPLDRLFAGIGSRIEANRRERGVYPVKEIKIPSHKDAEEAFSEYLVDAQRRLQLNQLDPGENVQTRDGHLTVSGQIAVMKINAILAKQIFEENPDNEFYVEESFPLEWMYPHLSPYGIIMKLNREPVESLGEEAVRKDHDFWRRYMERLIGDWISYDTSVEEITDFCEKAYIRGDHRGFQGDRKFMRDDNAQQSFSKLRSSVAKFYEWRMRNSNSVEEQELMIREADFAYKQSYALCPYSPEAIYHYVNLLASLERFDDADRIIRTSIKMDPVNTQLHRIKQELQRMKQASQRVTQLQGQMDVIETEFSNNPTNVQLAFELVNNYFLLQQTNKAIELLDKLRDGENASRITLLSVAEAYSRMGLYLRLETTLLILVEEMPLSPEVWYDLAAIQSSIGRGPQAIPALKKAFELNQFRLSNDPHATNLMTGTLTDPRFGPLFELPEFLELFKTPPVDTPGVDSVELPEIPDSEKEKEKTEEAP